MTEAEYNAFVRKERRRLDKLCPSEQRLERRKYKLKYTFGTRLEAEIERTKEKLMLLEELQHEANFNRKPTRYV